MRGDEIQGLKAQKLSSGKELDEVNGEIETLIDSQVEFKNNKKEIKGLTKEIKNLTTENEKLNKKVFSLQFKLDSASPQLQIEDNIQYLNIIMLMLRGQDKLTATEIAEKCNTKVPNINGGLKFLFKNKLIKAQHIGGGHKYWRE